jgi:hypothetical protein
MAITAPQMPLSEINGMVNLISAQSAKVRHLIFGACWRHSSTRHEIFARADLPICLGPTNIAKRNPEKWTKETQKLMAPLEWRRNRNFEGSKSYRKKSYEALWTGSVGGNQGSTARKSMFEWRWMLARADQPQSEGHVSLPPGSTLVEHEHTQGSLTPLAARTRHSAAP